MGNTQRTDESHSLQSESEPHPSECARDRNHGEMIYAPIINE